jgi:hypothetical protein
VIYLYHQKKEREVLKMEKVYTVKIKAETCERPFTIEYDRVYGVYKSYAAAEKAICELAGDEEISVVFDYFSWIHSHYDEWGYFTERFYIEALIQELELA